MSAAAVVITGGYLAYEQFGPKPKPEGASSKVGWKSGQAPGSNKEPARPPIGDGETGSAAGSETGAHAGSETASDPGTESPPTGRKITNIELPRLIGLTPEKATAELVRLGFEDGALQMPPDLICTYDDEKRDLVPVGTICNQERSPGSPLMSDAKVRVVIEYDTFEHGGVHAGDEWHRMPNVIGMPIDKARAVLRDHGFVDSEFAIGEARSSCGRGMVCEQVPKAGIRKYVRREGDLNLGD